jgi:hypothetical protein
MANIVAQNQSSLTAKKGATNGPKNADFSGRLSE